MENRIRAVLFDLDGLLSDTERVFYEAYQAVARKFGYELILEDYVLSELQYGRPSSVAQAIEASGVSLQTFRAELYEEYGKHLVGRVQAMPGARECVSRLRAHYPLGIVSSSRGKFLDYILGELKIAHHFVAIVCREDVVHSKPDPEGLNKALDVLGLLPSQALFVEDAERGMHAAHAIGMKCVVVPNRLLCGRVQYTGAIQLKSLDELTVDFIRSTKPTR